MVRRMTVAAVVVSTLFLAQGCVGRLVDEGIEKTLGPTAKVLPMQPGLPENSSGFLGQYKNFELAPLKSNFPETPSEFMTFFPIKMREQMDSRGLPMGKGGKTLVIEVTVLAYQPVSSYHKALGPTEEVVADVVLKDKETGKVVGHSVCIGRTYQSVGLGPQWKAWGLARAIVNDWIDPHYPKEGRIEREEQAPPSQG